MLSSDVLVQTTKPSIWKTIAVIMFAIVVVELLIMVAIDDPFTHVGFDWYRLKMGLIDSLSLGTIMSPIVYFALMIPLRRQTILAQEKIHALKDDLTGLPSRSLFEELVTHEIDVATRNVSAITLVVIDPSRLSEINQVFGYKFGDKILQQIGERLRSMLRKSDVEARISGDEFGVLLTSVNEDQIDATVKNLKRILHAPFQVEGISVNIGATMGVACFPQHATKAFMLIQRARTALSMAKNSLESYTTFNAEFESDTQDRIKLYAEIHNSIENGDFELYYQPKIYVETNELAGTEALIRWPTGTPGLTHKLIPFCEQVGLIDQITLWVANEAIRQASQWKAEGLSIPISINVSARDLMDNGLCDLFVNLCEKYQVPSYLITIEVTESAVMSSPEKGRNILHDLRSHGFHISIDDFGTGYSSLIYLKDIPANELKIDQNFISSLGSNPKSDILVNFIVQLGKKLGMRVVAEGVGTKELMQHIKSDGCEIAQGFYFSRPKPAGEFINWYKRQIQH